MPIERVLPCFTYNPSEVLKLSTKGRLEPKSDADILILDSESFEIQHIIANGQHLLKDGKLVKDSRQNQQVKESRPT